MRADRKPLDREGDAGSSDSYHFWRKNVRPGTTFGPFSRQPTLWQRFYDWLFRQSR